VLIDCDAGFDFQASVRLAQAFSAKTEGVVCPSAHRARGRTTLHVGLTFDAALARSSAQTTAHTSWPTPKRWIEPT
jgi:hypothetical protein